MNNEQVSQSTFDWELLGVRQSVLEKLLTSPHLPEKSEKSVIGDMLIKLVAFKIVFANYLLACMVMCQKASKVWQAHWLPESTAATRSRS